MRVHLIAAGKYHDIDFARLELLKLLAEGPELRTRVASSYADVGLLAAADLLITYTFDLVADDDQVMINIKRKDFEAMLAKGISPPAFEVAGPRRKVYFDASKLRCAIATCGGLCPGLNDIIRAIWSPS